MRPTPLNVVSSLARDAGRAAMRHYGTAESRLKAGGSPVTAADHAANDVIIGGLQRHFPGEPILSEESADSPDRLDASRLWIVDPLDGTKEFLAQNGEFSIMIGRVEGGAAVLGVVYMPDGDRLYAAARGQGAWVEAGGGERRRLVREPSAWNAIRLVGSRSHDDPLLTGMRDALGITDVRPSGSVGVKCALVAEGERDLYIHPVPYLKEWDTCAPEILLREAGGTVTDCLGQPLLYNKPDPRQPHGIVACAPGLHEQVIDTIESLYRAAHA